MATNYQAAVLADNPFAYYALNPGSDPAGVSPGFDRPWQQWECDQHYRRHRTLALYHNAAHFNGTGSMV